MMMPGTPATGPVTRPQESICAALYRTGGGSRRAPARLRAASPRRLTARHLGSRVHGVPGPGQRPEPAADDGDRVAAPLAGGYHPRRDELALLRDGQAEGRGHHRVLVLVPEHQDAF